MPCSLCSVIFSLVIVNSVARTSNSELRELYELFYIKKKGHKGLMEGGEGRKRNAKEKKKIKEKKKRKKSASNYPTIRISSLSLTVD